MPTIARLRLLVAVLSVLVIANIIFILGILSILTSLVPAEKTYTYIGDDFPAQLPLNLPPAALALSSSDARFGLDADEDWGTLFPLSDGFTTLRGPSSSPSNYPGRTFLISMVHELHCLDVLRVAFVANRTGAAVHTAHCLRYLRQTVLCRADTTLEPDEPGLRGGRWEHAASGVGAVHRCRDWTVLRRWMDDHPAEPIQEGGSDDRDVEGRDSEGVE
ncbi:hypothetical protein C2E23DRAFT_731274 [Lenzites betulinus]|nr:hypothetical protein C2E23DRAFT_731274 [Lenzites betulinus]